MLIPLLGAAVGEFSCRISDKTNLSSQLAFLLTRFTGPIIGGFMAARTTWRWMFWSTSIFQAIMILVSFTAFYETYAPYILQKLVAQLRKSTAIHATIPHANPPTNQSPFSHFFSGLYRDQFAF